MKIVNKRKFIRTISVLMLIFIGLLILTKNTYSKGETAYKENYIYSGDTLWSVAREEIQNNEYFENKDIRDVVYEIKKVNNLDSADLFDGQKIKIPTYKTSN